MPIMTSPGLLGVRALWILLGFVVLVVSGVASLTIGAASIGFQELLVSVWPFSSSEAGSVALSDVQQRIVWELRAPRTLLALLAGAGLSVAGAVLQNVTRNPLADPYLFGISSGASFGAVCVIAGLLGGNIALGSFAELGITVGAFIGSALSVLLVVSLAGRGSQIERMLLAGVACSFMFSAMTSLVLYISEPLAASSLIFWTLGSFARAQWGDLLLPGIMIFTCLVIFLAASRQLGAVLSGDESAKSLGVPVERLRIQMLLLSSLLTATLVATCGGIGFVGLMIPHITRRLVRSRGQGFFLITAALGGIFMLWVDMLARSLLDGVELPIGIITAVLGSVFFLILMRRRGGMS